MHAPRHSWQPAPQITRRLHGTLESRKGESHLKFKEVCGETECLPPQHIQDVMCLGEKCLGSSVLTEVQVLLNNLSKHIIPCVRGRSDFSHFEGRVPSAESQLSVLENLFCWRFHASPVPQTQAACVILCFEIVLFSPKWHVCVSFKNGITYYRINTASTCAL